MISNISDAQVPEILVVNVRATIVFHNSNDLAPPFPVGSSHFCPRFRTMTIYTSIAFGHLHWICGDRRIVP